jgi:hypothetical protein
MSRSARLLNRLLNAADTCKYDLKYDLKYDPSHSPEVSQFNNAVSRGRTYGYAPFPLVSSNLSAVDSVLRDWSALPRRIDM